MSFRETKVGDCGWIEQTIDFNLQDDDNSDIEEPEVNPYPLTARMYLVDSRIDKRYHGVRRIDVLVNGKVVYSRGVSDAVKSNWVELPLEPPADGKPRFRIVVRVTEITPVTDHTSWVFVGPMFVY